MTQELDSRQGLKRTANLRTALVLWGIALTFFIATIASKFVG